MSTWKVVSLDRGWVGDPGDNFPFGTSLEQHAANIREAVLDGLFLQKHKESERCRQLRQNKVSAPESNTDLG